MAPRQDTTKSRRRKFMATMDDNAAPRAPAPDHLVLCPIDCDRPLDRCHCLRGMLADRGLAAAPAGPQPGPDWRPLPPPTPEQLTFGHIPFEPDFSTGLAPLLIALALGITAVISFALAWWLA